MSHDADKITPSDEELGRFSRRQHHLYEMVRKGALPASKLGELFQLIVDGKLLDWQGLVVGTHEISVAKLLQEVGVTAVPAATSKFVARNNFRLKKDGGICSSLGSDFTEWFLKGDGKAEAPITEQILRYSKLRQWSVYSSPIITELGGEAKVETTLSEMFSLIEKQKNGGSGPLLVNGLGNIFYIKDQSGVLRAVIVRWSYGGWDVYALSVEYPHRWGDGFQVFSRNSESLGPLASAQA